MSVDSKKYILSESVIYRKMKAALVVAHLETGDVFYFSPETDEFFQFFSEPRTLADFFQALPQQSADSDSEQKTVELMQLLIDSKILAASSKIASSAPAKFAHSVQPLFLKKAEQRLDQLTFLSPC